MNTTVDIREYAELVAKQHQGMTVEEATQLIIEDLNERYGFTPVVTPKKRATKPD